MSEKQTFLKDKSYGFVPFIQTCKQTKGLDQRTFADNTYSGKLKLKLTTQTPLHIGSGIVVCNEDGEVLHKTMRRNNTIIIPGSSFKGVVRGIFEAVSFSCGVKLPDPRVRDLEQALPKKNRFPCNKLQFMCPTCSTFGMATRDENYRGKVNFGEFMSDGNVKTSSIELVQQESPFRNYPEKHDVFLQGNYGNERLYYCMACDSGDCGTCEKQNYRSKVNEAGRKREMKFRGRKFYYTDKREVNTNQEEKEPKMTCIEMVDQDTSFTGEVVFQNITESELKILAYALNIGKHFNMKLGYGKPFGFGLVGVELIDVENLMSRYTGVKGLTCEEVEQKALQYKENCEPEIKEAIQRLEQIMG